MEKLRFGICGLGFMGRTHFARLRGHPQAELVAVCDQDARRRAGDWRDAVGNLNVGQADGGGVSLAGIAAYATVEELIADPRVDVVLVALPTSLHAAVTVAALTAGKHVLCEKPMAVRVADCDRMVRAARTSGRTLMVAQCIRFWPQYAMIKRCVDEGRIGAVRFMTLRRLGSPPMYSMDNWLMHGGQSGGALLDLHVHDVDFAQYMLGIPDAIHARGTRGPSGEYDHVAATWGYADGRYVSIEGGWMLAAPWSFEMEVVVHGERGTLAWALSRGRDVLLHSGGERAEPIPTTGDAYRQELDYFIECVQAGQPVARCLPMSSRVSVALSWLERRAIERGRIVPLPARLHTAWSV